MANKKSTPSARAKMQPLRIGFLIHDVSRMRRTFFDQSMKPHGVTRAQWWLLANLSRHVENGMTQTDLARLMDVGKVSIGGHIDRLEKSGHVERHPDPEDRRVNRVFITAHGHKVLEGMKAVSHVVNTRILHGISSDDVRVAENVLQLMKENLRACLNGESVSEFDEFEE